MTFLEGIKKSVERATGWQRPSGEELAALPQVGKPAIFRFSDDGLIPNHPRWPLVVYRRAVRLPRKFDPAAVFEDVFASNGWGDMWRNGIYDYLHYHSRIHEVLGIARGSAKVRFGGEQGRTLEVQAGDVVSFRPEPDISACRLDLVSRFRRSHHFAARTFANVGNKGTLASLWF